MEKENNYCVIMAGGIGSRFWPMSKSTFPKQFHDILGTGKTLIQMTFERFLNICPKENIYIVTNADYKALVLEQLPDIKEDQVMCEPCMRNTAPCIAFANFRIQSINPNAKIIVAPSDHLITNEVEFVRITNVAIAEAEGENLVTLGITPSRPDTGYGYIRFSDSDTEVKGVRNFEEKPNVEKAKEFLADGNYLWNSGIFIWSLKNIQKAFVDYLPNIYTTFDDASDLFGTSEEEEWVKENYKDCENISIDYGIMEKANNVSVVPADFGWSDLGTWGSLGDHLTTDTDQNQTLGQVMSFDAKQNLVFSSDSEKLILIEGLDDHIVVDTKEALLICKKSSEQKIKEMVTKVKEEFKGKYT